MFITQPMLNRQGENSSYSRTSFIVMVLVWGALYLILSFIARRKSYLWATRILFGVSCLPIFVLIVLRLFPSVITLIPLEFSLTFIGDITGSFSWASYWLIKTFSWFDPYFKLSLVYLFIDYSFYFLDPLMAFKLHSKLKKQVSPVSNS